MFFSGEISEPLNILFVDDQIEILNALKRQISTVDKLNGFFVTNPLEVMDIIETENVHIIVADVVMPEQDGISLLREVKIKHPDIIRILLTAYGDYNTSLRAINEAEVFGFITKPWSQDYLLAHIKMAGQMINDQYNQVIHDQLPIIVTALWDDAQGITEISHTIDNDNLARHFSNRVFMTASALFGSKYRFQNNQFTLPFKESSIIVRGYLYSHLGDNLGVFVFLEEFETNEVTKLDDIINEISTTAIDDIDKTYLADKLDQLRAL